jgi:hypothetical protein
MKKYLDSAYSIGNVSFPTRRRSPKQLLGHIMPGNKPDKDHVLVSLHDYLVLDPKNQRAKDLLDRLEVDGVLPLTISWWGEAGKKLRLYQLDPLAFGMPSFTVRAKDLHFEVKTGLGEFHLIPEFRDEEDRGRWLPQYSPLDLEPVMLPLTLFLCLSLLDQYARQPVETLRFILGDHEGLPGC